MNRWSFGFGFWTLTRAPSDLPGYHCYGTGETKKEAVRAWLDDVERARQSFDRLRRAA
jgi:hypothetical protein